MATAALSIPAAASAQTEAPRVPKLRASFERLIDASVTGQAEQPAPKTSSATTTHPFWDRLNVTLTVVEIAAVSADATTTQIGLHRYPGLIREGNPVFRPLVEQGWAGQLASMAIVVSGELALRYLIHRHGEHRVERWIPILISTGSFAAATRNARVLSNVTTCGTGPSGPMYCTK